MRELCHVRFCMLSCCLWMAIMPKEHLGVSTGSHKKGIWGCALVFTKLHTFKECLCCKFAARSVLLRSAEGPVKGKHLSCESSVLQS